MKRKSFTKESSLEKAVILRCKLLPVPTLLLLVSLALMQSCKKVDVNANKTNSTSSQNATANTSFDLKLVADNFVSPLGVVDPKDGTNRLFVIDQIGKIWIMKPNGNTLSTPFLDLTSKIVPLSP